MWFKGCNDLHVSWTRRCPSWMAREAHQGSGIPFSLWCLPLWISYTLTEVSNVLFFLLYRKLITLIDILYITALFENTCMCNAKTYVSAEVRVVLMKLAWMVSYRDTLLGIYLLHTLMANDAKVLRNTVFEVIHPACSLPKRIRKELIITNISFAAEKRMIQSISKQWFVSQTRFKGCPEKIDRCAIPSCCWLDTLVWALSPSEPHWKSPRFNVWTESPQSLPPGSMVGMFVIMTWSGRKVNRSQTCNFQNSLCKTPTRSMAFFPRTTSI